jgi:hypothetical protein
MSNVPQEDRETRRIVSDFTRLLREKSEEEREELLTQARDEALAEELAVAREQSEREAAALREELARDPATERDRARETAKSAALLLIMLLLILLLVAAATGRTDILPIPGVQATQTLRPIITPLPGGKIGIESAFPTVPPGTTPEIDPLFLGKLQDWNLLSGKCNIGNPISPSFTDRGLRSQWFQRVLLREMPAYIDDADWHIQGWLLGREVTSGFIPPFPTATPFVSQPDKYLFRETGYSVSSPFLDFWYDCHGLWLLGYPVTQPVYEVLTPGQQPYLVQYFERGRLELHPEDPVQQVQFGLLGDIKKKDANFKPNIVTPQAATPAAVPTATSTARPAATAVPNPTATSAPSPGATARPVPAATAYPGP